MITRNRMRLPVVAVEAVVCPKGEAAIDGGRLSTLFTYDARDPFAVTLTLTGYGVDWVLARTLLADGVNAGAGEGDVYVCPDVHGKPVVAVTLFGDTGTLILRFSRSDIERVLDAMERIVPEGSESGRIDWSREFGWLVSGGEAA
ncbi:SsgA family sporulation/cell division regulator [Amycolatopsis benzoatilytica]|uniref:SsgA family sporulation/cell division regulator n=1 Tax=Amycolatopsis benzoatilytica TaxID=346045 RepID=UPI0003717376|nr:SsgA family sporulation/cell division regulator [Amycolatopsis benzoatilytica]